MKIVCVAGARPNFMKIAPLIHEMNMREGIEPVLVHTGQHYDASMSDLFFRQLGIPDPDINLEVGSGTRDEQIEKIMARFDDYLADNKPDAVLVVGDVNSTIACVRVARKYDIPTIHVEAGLRSFDQTMPEEINRVETDQLSDYLFVTEESGVQNLNDEGVPGKAFLVGNVMIDTLIKQLSALDPDAIVQAEGLTAGEYMVATFHRPSNVDAEDALANVLHIIEYAAEQGKLFIPLHPRTRNSLEKHGWLERLTGNPNVIVSDPKGYVEFVSLVSRARGIVTDSGGVQEETTYLGVPCITMRDNTERPVTVDVGTNVLAGTDTDDVCAALDTLFAGQHKHGEVPPLWDGKAARRIVELLKVELANA